MKLFYRIKKRLKAYKSLSRPERMLIRSLKVRPCKKITAEAGNREMNELGWSPKAQLTEIWNEANKATPEQSLIQEAKKYNTAEEFVASNKTLYHGTKERFEAFDLGRSGDVQPSDWGAGIYFTDNPEHAQNFAAVAGGDVVLERYAPNVTFADGKKLLKDSDFMLTLDDGMGFTSPAEYLSTKGYDGIRFKNPAGFTEYVVFDPSQIKTKAQLIEIWNEAHQQTGGRLDTVRMYAHVGHMDGYVCVSHDFGDLPEATAIGILLHELGHLLCPNGEPSADLIIKKKFGIEIKYSPEFELQYVDPEVVEWFEKDI